jgi:hypothetical protein
MLSDGSARFLQGTGIDQPLQVDTSLSSSSYLQDHLGSASQLVDALNSSRKARYDYTSYGKLEGDERNPIPSHPFTYTGREDNVMGRLYYRARYYDPEPGCSSIGVAGSYQGIAHNWVTSAIYTCQKDVIQYWKSASKKHKY